MIHLSGRLICKTAAELSTVQLYLPDHIRLSLAEPGCVAFAITQSDDPLIWDVSETFVDMAAFDAHQTRTSASPWFAATRHILRAFGQPVQHHP